MRILMLLNAPYPEDIRVTKEAKALIKGGHLVYLLCVKKGRQPSSDQIDQLQIFRVRTGNHIYIRALWDILMGRGAHPMFYFAAKKVIKRENIEAVHIHDLPLAGTGIALKKRFPGLKMIADLHENYPEGLKIWHKWKTSPVVRLKNNLFMKYKTWYNREREAVLNADKVIAVVEEMKEKLIRNHGISSEKITVITNTEEAEFTKQETTQNIYTYSLEEFIVAYCGGIGPHRGVDTAIKGFVHLKDLPNIKLKIVGFGSAPVMKYIKGLVSQNKLESQVQILGYQPFSKFYSYMNQADINIIPHHKNGHTENTIPHKLFQCMMSAKPLLVSSCAPLKRVVKQCNSGLIFEAGDDVDFAEKIRKLYGDNWLRKELGKNGYQSTVMGDLNWKNTGKKLSEMYESL